MITRSLRGYITCALTLFILFFSSQVWAQSGLPRISLSVGGGGGTEIASAIKIFLFLTLISVGPAIILTMTCFPRIIIVLSFLRQAIGVPQSPPNQVLVGLALFLTLFLMTPLFEKVKDEAFIPFTKEQIDLETAIQRGGRPLKEFMLSQTRRSDLELLLSISKTGEPKNVDELPLSVAIPAFIISELKTAFQIGFLIYLPFILIDMVVSVLLLTMGMMVLPPVVISLPFKLMLFVMVDGWELVIGSLIRSFQ